MFRPLPKNAPKPKPRGGWDDDDEGPPQLKNLNQFPSSFLVSQSLSSVPQSVISDDPSKIRAEKKEEDIKLSQIEKFGSDFELLEVNELLERKM